MDEASETLVARTEPIAAVFQAGLPVYLRRRIAGLDKIVLVSCAGVSPGTLILRWLDAVASGVPPREGEEVTCQALLQGVLHVASGFVEEVTAGKQPRLRIRVQERCLAVPLRKWPRYSVQGRLRMSQAGGSRVLSQNSFRGMNVSLGGFGIELGRDMWDGPDEVEFVLELLVERNGKADESLPGVNVAGDGVIRRRQAIAERNATYYGVQFTAVPEEQVQALEFWLAAHSAYLRGV
jgi:hypothetical protein